MSKQFNIFDLSCSEFVREGATDNALRLGSFNWNHAYRIWPDAASATAECQRLTQLLGRKFQPRPVKVSAEGWRKRELGRLLDGTYTTLPWRGFRPGDQANPELCATDWAISYRHSDADHHYPHMSGKVKGNIAFTESEEKGAADVQTTMKPGRYLKRFYGMEPGSGCGLSEHDIRRLANELIAKFGNVELKFATTPDEIVHVYRNGPASCMSHQSGEYSSGGHHPVGIYGAGDLAVAYLVVKAADGGEDDTDDDAGTGSICSRVLCWPEKKIYGRMYGDTQKMAHFLQEAGYTEGDDWYFEGARMLRISINSGRRFVMPYVDGEYKTCRDSGDYLILDCEGDIDCEVTSGWTDQAGRRRESEYTCGHCGDSFYESDLRSFRQGPRGAAVWVCESCAESGDGVFTCQYDNETYAGDDYVVMANGDEWHVYNADRYAFRSAHSDEYYPVSVRVEMGNGDYVATEELIHFATQSATGSWWPTEELVKQEDGTLRHPDEATAAAESAELLTAINEAILPREEYRLLSDAPVAAVGMMPHAGRFVIFPELNNEGEV